MEPGHLPDDLALRLARVRELTEPPAEKGAAPPPSTKTGETMAADVGVLIELGQTQVVETGL